jgi:hypothetical protein
LAEETKSHAVYLPVVQRGIVGKPTATATPKPTSSPTETATPTPPVVTAFFADTQWRTSSNSLATDGQGGIHLAYVYYNGLAENVPNSGVYQVCASNCDQPAQWKGVRLGEEVDEIQLRLTPEGRPRILFRTDNANNGRNFFYATCDTGCTDPKNWQVGLVASNEGMAPIEISDDELPQRYFALDNLGRPRFVYNDRKGTHYGTFYTFCDANCTNPANWGEVRLNKDNNGSGPYRDEDLFSPALAFSPTGQPRIVADGVTMQDEFFLYYVACDAGCDQRENWQSAPLFPRGNGFEFSFDLEINANGDPRIAWYEGAHVGGGGNVLNYVWCNDACTQPGNWSRHVLGLPVLEGQEPDLELDGAGRPHIAYALYKDGGLGYSVCTATCEGSNGQWQHKVLESRTQIAQSTSVALPLICSGGIWDGLTPTLALDGAGNPYIAYDATHYARCHYEGEDKWKPWNEMNLVWRAVRVRLANRNAAPGTPTATPTVEPGTPTPTKTATATPTQTATPTATPEPPARLGSGVAPETNWQTSSSAVAVDRDNRLHLAYVFTDLLFGPDPDGNQNPTSAVYRTCQSSCDQPQNWTNVPLGANVSEVQIGVTPNGQPRLLTLVRAGTADNPADSYVYAECNQNCTHGASWTLTTIATVPNDLSWHWLDDPSNMEDVAREGVPRRYFALDPEGRPRFVYYHYNAEADLNGVGAYYAACDGDCTHAGNWTHTRISEVTDWSGALEWEILEKPVLTFAPNGAPRILAAVLPLGILRFPGLYYVACDSNCTEGSNWLKVQLGNGDDVNGEWDMALDAAGRPYVVIGYGWQAGMKYAWCDENCLEFTSWQVADGPQLEIGRPHVVMDIAEQPQILYKTTEYDETGNNPDNSLYYLWCDSNCRAADATWKQVRIENSENVRAEWPKPIPPACADGEWYQLASSMVIGLDGAVHIATDTFYLGKCEYDAGSGSWGEGDQFAYSTYWRAARIVSVR